MKESGLKRDWNADLIRCVAVFSVICVHFFLNIGFYDQKIIGYKYYILMTMRTLFMVCVPMFLMLSGYLMNKKKLKKKYYKGILKTLEIYLFASIICIIFKSYYYQETYTLKTIILSILNFNTSEYAWYIEMYIGLFLLIPFLNLIWNNLSKKEHKKNLIITLIILTAIPPILNVYDWTTPGYFLNNTISRNYQQIVPDYWYNMYPLTYYFIGAYLKEYKIKTSLKKLVPIFIGIIILLGSINFFRNNGGTFDYSMFTDWGSLQNVITTTLLFIILLKVKTPDNIVVQNIIYNISKISLGTYLLSFIPDRMTYPGLLILVKTPENALIHFPIVVLEIFIISLLLSFIMDYIIKYFNKLIKYVHTNIRI